MDIRKTALCAAALFMLSAPAAAWADGGLVFSLPESAEVSADGHIRVSVDIEDNPGVQSWVLLLGYDSSEVTFVGLEGGVVAGANHIDRPGAGVVEINFFGSRDVSSKGTAVTAEFALKEGAKDCVFTLTPSGDEDNFFNFSDETVVCTVSNGRLRASAGKAENASGGTAPSGSAPEPAPAKEDTSSGADSASDRAESGTGSGQPDAAEPPSGSGAEQPAASSAGSGSPADDTPAPPAEEPSAPSAESSESPLARAETQSDNAAPPAGSAESSAADDPETARPSDDTPSPPTGADAPSAAAAACCAAVMCIARRKSPKVFHK